MLMFTPSDIALIGCFFVALALTIYFALGKPRVWFRDRLGWVLFGYALATDALLALIVYGVVFGQRVEEPLRLLVALALGAALIAKIWAIFRERRRGRRPGMRSYSQPNPENERQ